MGDAARVTSMPRGMRACSRSRPQLFEGAIRRMCRAWRPIRTISKVPRRCSPKLASRICRAVPEPGFHAPFISELTRDELWHDPGRRRDRHDCRRRNISRLLLRGNYPFIVNHDDAPKMAALFNYLPLPFRSGTSLANTASIVEPTGHGWKSCTSLRWQRLRTSSQPLLQEIDADHP